MRTIICPHCEAKYQLAFDHFYGKICKCGESIPSDGDTDRIKKNRIKNNKTTQKALDSVARRVLGDNND
jgi:hypothetical protein